MRTQIAQYCLAMAVMTYFTRACFTLCVSKMKIGAIWGRMFAIVPLAVLSALVTPLVFFARGSFTAFCPHTLAALVTLALAMKTRNVLVAAGLGLGLFIAITQLV